MKLLPLLIVGATISLSLNLVSIIPAIAQTAPICKNPNGRTRDRTNPTETQRNAQGCVTEPYPYVCATQNCFNCGDFQYQEDAQKFFNAFSNDPSGLDGRPGQATAGVPHVVCENRPRMQQNSRR
jgi:hypothetical protein